MRGNIIQLDLTCKQLDEAIAQWKARNSAPRTNADRIRAMSDEELASTLGYCCPAEGAVPESDCDAFGNCTECWLKWLKQEVDE